MPSCFSCGSEHLVRTVKRVDFEMGRKVVEEIPLCRQCAKNVPVAVRAS